MEQESVKVELTPYRSGYSVRIYRNGHDQMHSFYAETQWGAKYGAKRWVKKWRSGRFSTQSFEI